MRISRSAMARRSGILHFLLHRQRAHTRFVRTMYFYRMIAISPVLIRAMMGFDFSACAASRTHHGITGREQRYGAPPQDVDLLR